MLQEICCQAAILWWLHLDHVFLAGSYGNVTWNSVRVNKDCILEYPYRFCTNIHLFSCWCMYISFIAHRFVFFFLKIKGDEMCPCTHWKFNCGTHSSYITAHITALGDQEETIMMCLWVRNKIKQLPESSLQSILWTNPNPLSARAGKIKNMSNLSHLSANCYLCLRAVTQISLAV